MDVHPSASSSTHDWSLLGDIIPGHNMEGGEDGSLEWLSIYVEDCLSSSSSYTTSPPFLLPHINQPQQGSPPSSSSQTCQDPKRPLEDLGAPAKGTHKRRRVTPRSLSHVSPSDPLFLHQTCWLADSELLVPKKDEERETGGGGGGGGGEKLMKEGLGQPRKCSHCHSQKTPQWRAGPLGPKTLCNACGVRFMSGRLLPEYRPAKSPTFVSFKHSNVHKKVLEMRKASTSTSTSVVL